MKKYLNPSLEVLNLNLADVLTTSVSVEPPENLGRDETPGVNLIPRR